MEIEKKKFLFREDALSKRFNRNLGTVRIKISLNYKVLSIICGILIIILFLFLLFANMSEKIRVRGFLDADKGIISVSSLYHGTILESKVVEGQTVNRGDTLFVIRSNEHENTYALIKNLKQRMENFKAEHRLKKEHYQSMIKLYKAHFVSASLIKTIEAELLEISNKIKTIDLEVIKYKQNDRQFVKSPTAGLVTNILYRQNQVIEQSKTLLQIIPEHSKLIARLYVPVRDSGFLKRNREVLIQYDAYPCSRFGTHKAVIKEINLSILTDAQEEKPIKIGKPYYKIAADLEDLTISLYGKQRNLQVGMTLTGIISGEKKKIWQWIVSPFL